MGIILLIAAVIGIGALARRRGGSAFIWGVIAASGVVFIVLLLRDEIITSDIVNRLMVRNLAVFVPSMLAWLWIGAVALFVRFGLGARQEQPNGMWTCHECKTLNKGSSLYCDACKSPWQKAASEGEQP